MGRGRSRHRRGGLLRISCRAVRETGVGSGMVLRSPAALEVPVVVEVSGSLFNHGSFILGCESGCKTSLWLHRCLRGWGEDDEERGMNFKLLTMTADSRFDWYSCKADAACEVLVHMLSQKRRIVSPLPQDPSSAGPRMSSPRRCPSEECLRMMTW